MKFNKGKKVTVTPAIEPASSSLPVEVLCYTCGHPESEHWKEDGKLDRCTHSETQGDPDFGNIFIQDCGCRIFVNKAEIERMAETLDAQRNEERARQIAKAHEVAQTAIDECVLRSRHKKATADMFDVLKREMRRDVEAAIAHFDFLEVDTIKVAYEPVAGKLSIGFLLRLKEDKPPDACGIGHCGHAKSLHKEKNIMGAPFNACTVEGCPCGHYSAR